MCPQIGPLQYAREPAGRQDGVRHTIGVSANKQPCIREDFLGIGNRCLSSKKNGNY